MNKILRVARREYIEHVKTKSFIVGIVLLPILVAGSVVIQNLLEKTESGGTVVVVDVAATVVVVVAAEVLVVDAGVDVVVGSAPLTQPVPTTNNATTTATIRPLMPANLAR